MTCRLDTPRGTGVNYPVFALSYLLLGVLTLGLSKSIKVKLAGLRNPRYLQVFPEASG